MNTPTPTPTCGELSCDECNARTAALTAERDQLRTALALGQINCDAEYDDLRDDRDQLRAEVERLRAGIEECLRTNAHLADGENCTLIDLKHCLRDSRVERAEAAETVALAQWNGALERAMKLRAELAAERARLDWVFRNCKVTADDYTTGHRDVYAIHDREDLGAAMKEGAK